MPVKLARERPQGKRDVGERKRSGKGEEEEKSVFLVCPAGDESCRPSDLLNVDEEAAIAKASTKAAGRSRFSCLDSRSRRRKLAVGRSYAILIRP